MNDHVVISPFKFMLQTLALTLFFVRIKSFIFLTKRKISNTHLMPETVLLRLFSRELHTEHCAGYCSWLVSAISQATKGFY